MTMNNWGKGIITTYRDLVAIGSKESAIVAEEYPRACTRASPAFVAEYLIAESRACTHCGQVVSVSHMPHKAAIMPEGEE